MSLTHHINRVRFEEGREGQESGITDVRVANRIGLVDFPIQEVIARMQHGESFETWIPDPHANSIIQEDVRLVTDHSGHPYLHATEHSLSELPRF